MPLADIFVISDSRSTGDAVDKSGPILVEMLSALKLETTAPKIIPDEIEQIRDAVRRSALAHDLIVTSGGTGVGVRDVTPEAIEPLFERQLPGFGEIMRCGSYDKTSLSIISRGGAGIVGNTLVVMLPGSPKGVRDGMELLGPAIKHVLKILSAEKVDCQKESGGNP